MRAMVCTKYGSPDFVKLQEVEKPVPKDREVRVKVYATTVATGDCRVRSFNSPFLYWIPMRLFLGILRPRQSILGVELAGEVEAVGQGVKRFKKGDRVYALTGMRFGAHAEYACVPEDGVISLQPTNMTYEEAVAIPFGGTTAIYFLRKGQIRNGLKVLIYGASGSVGTAAVQLAKHFGAHVTGVCSGVNADLVRSLGADQVIDYAKEDYAEAGVLYDLIFDTIGKSSKSKGKKALAPNGRYVSVVGQGIVKTSAEDLAFLQSLIEAGELQAVIDRRYPLDRIPDAYRYVETGRKKGNVVVTVAHEG
ncbi:NAD(P)-dependent alcohol dehydrogenase [Cohnella nanjingensis]|uniref:NAD(P)-dependent alcohol dehydrogenase n=1 Tax=Cohnella nanjingensis TaxID=1387779 RepID=A0A7X0VD18_9BACL|nr:NAD(P)-dependent alcohol dehydrogenase [Cohnella nanjingensis]MBB6669490.1 NAD(P)-dependent alcohol dehydrogenase [Cohnella nanjingensis]